MIKVKEFFIRSFELEKINLFWEIEDITTTDDIMVYDIYILRSQFQEGPFVQIAGPLNNVFTFQDNTTPIEHKTLKIFYKLKIINRLTNETLEVAPKTNIAPPDLTALEIIRQENKLFRGFIGKKCWIFQMRKYGQCTCYDKTLKRTTISNCRLCYGTGFLGGYSSPIEQYIQIDPSDKTIQAGQNINQICKITAARLINYPIINPNDIIIESENLRWIVISVKQTERLRHPIRQELTLKEAFDTDIIYKLPIKLDLKNIDTSDKRNFTNPLTE